MSRTVAVIGTFTVSHLLLDARLGLVEAFIARFLSRFFFLPLFAPCAHNTAKQHPAAESGQESKTHLVDACFAWYRGTGSAGMLPVSPSNSNKQLGGEGLVSWKDKTNSNSLNKPRADQFLGRAGPTPPLFSNRAEHKR